MNTKSIIGKNGLVKYNERKKIKSLTSDKSEKRLNLVSNDKYKVRGNHRYSSKTFIYKGKHIGIDFASSIGDHVHAVADGKVVFAGKAGGYGNLIIIKHGNNYETYYAHLNNFSSGIELGKDVARGEEVGYVGTTGLSTGPHLHFELRKDGGYIDPFDKDSVLELWELTKEESQQLVLQMLMLVVTAAPSSAHYSSSN